MKITQLEVYRSPIPLTEPFVTSLGPDTHARNVIVVVRTDEGITGFGECNPYMPISGESMETAAEVAKYLGNYLLNKDPLHIGDHSAAFDRIIYGNASVKSAFDIALYDISAQHADVPLYVFLGGKNDKTLVTDYTVSIGDVKKMASDAEKIVANGFRIIKAKLGGSMDVDVQRIRGIRQAVGDDIPLRIDANQGWTVKTALPILQALGPFHIQHCEEPVPRHDFMELPRIRRQSPVKIMADESCCDHHDARRLIDLQACDSFNIKLGKSSGLFKAMKIAALAEANNIPVQVGGFLESRLGFTASAHFALACRMAEHCDFDTPLMFREDPVSNGIIYGSGGVVTVPDRPGLGAVIGDGYLKKLEKFVIK